MRVILLVRFFFQGLNLSISIQEKARTKGEKVVVHCSAGCSRSVTITLAYMMKHKKMTLLEALTWIRKRRPIVYPNKGFYKQLIEYETEINGKSSIPLIGLEFHEYVGPV